MLFGNIYVIALQAIEFNFKLLGITVILICKFNFLGAFTSDAVDEDEEKTVGNVAESENRSNSSATTPTSGISLNSEDVEHDGSLYWCTFCNLTFNRLSQLRAHEQVCQKAHIC